MSGVSSTVRRGGGAMGTGCGKPAIHHNIQWCAAPRRNGGADAGRRRRPSGRLRAMNRSLVRAASSAGLAAALAAQFVTAGCAGLSVAAPASALSAELFPLGPSTASYAMRQGELRPMRIEPTPAGAAMFLGGGRVDRRVDVERTATGLAFRGGPESSTEILRFGARSGESWQSGASLVRFEGWERIEVPAGVFDAARITTSIPGQEPPHDETWWFAPDAGLVRLRSSYGGLFVEELSLATK